MTREVGLVDYGRGNLLSVFHALEACGAEVHMCRTPEALLEAERIVLPGVGSFGDCMDALRERGLTAALQKKIVEDGRPFLGICLGMQIMAQKGYESGERAGLGWIEGEVKLLDGKRVTKVPHMGWDDVQYVRDSILFRGLAEKPDFYFAHSYYLDCPLPSRVEARCDYGFPFPVAVRHKNMAGIQFHPEKSQDVGLRVLENFMAWNP